MAYCSKCGDQVKENDNFCTACGTAVPRYASGFSQKKPKRVDAHTEKHQTAGVFAIIASGLALILFFEFVIGPAIWGRTIFGGTAPSDKAISMGSAMVSSNNPVAKIGVVTVDFGENIIEETELRIQTGTQAPKSDYFTGIDVYDFTLQGQSQFSSPVDITLPNTAGFDEAAYVAYFNEEIQEWEQVPYEINGDKVVFSTRHFSRYGLVKYHRNRYAGPLTPLVINYDELRKALNGIEEDGLFERFLEEKGQIGSNELINKALAVSNDAIGYTSIPVSYEAMVARIGDAAAKELADKLTLVGGALTVLKVAYQLQAQDSINKTIQDNIFDICELALGGAALAIPSSTLLPVAAAGVFMLGLGYDYVLVPAYEDDSLQFAYKAYYDYCMYPHIAYDKNRAKALADGSGEESPWVVLQTYNTKTKKWESAQNGAGLLSLNQSFSGKWKEALMDCYDLYIKDPKAMQERIDALIDEYLDVFWTLDGLEPVQFAQDYCGIAEEDWRWPDVAETQQMKNAVKAELMRELKPVFERAQQTVVEDMQKTLLQQTNDLVKHLNTEIAFIIVDPEADKEGFEHTRVANDIIRIESVTSAHQEDWVCQPGRYGQDIIFACTLNNYLKEGCPDKVCFYKTQKDLKAGNPYMTVDLHVEMPLTKIVLGQEQGIPGTYSNTASGAIEMFPNEWALRQCMQYQFKDITVDNSGQISCNAPAQDATFKGVYGINEEYDVNASFGAAELSGQIDLETGTGRAQISGSVEALCQFSNSATTWTAFFSGDMSIAYVNDSLVLISSPDNLSVHLSGQDITRDLGGSTLADFDTDIQLQEQLVYKKTQ